MFNRMLLLLILISVTFPNYDISNAQEKLSKIISDIEKYGYDNESKFKIKWKSPKFYI